MPFAFAERVPPPDQLKTVPTPWAVAGPLTTPAPHTQETAARAVDNGRDSRHHHYYKKHMTMLGLRKELDSSDTDSDVDAVANIMSVMAQSWLTQQLCIYRRHSVKYDCDAWVDAVHLQCP